MLTFACAHVTFPVAFTISLVVIRFSRKSRTGQLVTGNVGLSIVPMAVNKHNKDKFEKAEHDLVGRAQD